jgi:hypothetical protein
MAEHVAIAQALNRSLQKASVQALKALIQLKVMKAAGSAGSTEDALQMAIETDKQCQQSLTALLPQFHAVDLPASYMSRRCQVVRVDREDTADIGAQASLDRILASTQASASSH